MNIVEELVVAIGLDSSAYTKGQREATDAFNKTRDAAVKGGKEIEERSKTSAEMFGKLRNQVVALFAVFTGGVGLKEFISTMTASDAAAGRLATGLGISVKTLTAYQGAAEAAGGSSQGMANAFASMADNLQQFINTGSSQLPALFTALAREGGKAIDVNLPLPELMDTILEDLAKIAEVNPQRATSFAKQFGLAELVPFLTQGIDKFRELKKEMDKYAETKEQARGANELRTAWILLKAEWASVGREVLESLRPALMGTLDMLKQFSDWAKAHPEAMKIAFEAITASIVGLSAAMLGLTIASSPWLFIAGAIAAAGVLIYENWDKIGAMLDRLSAKINAFAKDHPWIMGLLKAGASVIPGVGVATAGAGVAASPEGVGIARFLIGPKTYDQMFGAGTAPAASGAAAAPAASTGASVRDRSRGGLSGWWTPDRQQQAMDYLSKNTDLPEVSRRALVARWAGVESTSKGPFDVNSIGATGIAQWLGSRKAGVRVGDFEGQLKHVVDELKTTESRAYNALKNAVTPGQAAAGAAQYERAEGYNGVTDNFVNKTVAAMRNVPSTGGGASVWDKVGAQPSLAAAAQSAATQGDVWNDNRKSAATTNTSSHEVNIHGPVNVNTQATDANGIAKDFVSSVVRAHKYGALNYGTN